MPITRREFLASSAIAAGTLSAAGGAMPTRILGRTGLRVSILAFGSGSRFLQGTDDEAVALLTKALDLGVNYIDTADAYGRDRLSERRIGLAIRGRRRDLVIATKTSNRDGSQARQVLETSLKALQVDQLDVLHIHSLTDADDLASIEAKGGVLEQLLKFRDEKLTRAIGISSHTDPMVLKTALERHDFDCVQMALNAGTVAMMNGTAPNGKKGMVPNPAMKTSFETLALPVAVKKGMGVLAMKSFAQDALIGQATVEKLMYYTLTLPVAAAVVGMPKAEHVEQNIALAKAFKPLPADEMKHMATTLSEKNKMALDRFFRHHVDG